MMTFLLFAPAKWLGWRKDRKSRRDRLGRFCDIYCAVTSILFCVRCYQWHSLEHLFWKVWTKRHSLNADEVIRCVLWIYKHLESLPDTSSQIFDWKPCQILFLVLWPEEDSAPNISKTSEQRLAFVALAERWTITEIRQQSYSVLTYSLLTDVLPL